MFHFFVNSVFTKVKGQMQTLHGNAHYSFLSIAVDTSPNKYGAVFYLTSNRINALFVEGCSAVCGLYLESREKVNKKESQLLPAWQNAGKKCFEMTPET